MSRETSRGEAAVKDLCELFRVSRQAYYAARKRPKQAGPRRPRPGGNGPWVPNDRLEAAIRDIAAKHPSWGIRKVHATLRRNGIRAGRRRVHAVMGRLGLLQAPPGEPRLAVRRGHVAVPEANRRWATDLTTAWTRQDGWVAVVPVIDCGDRYLLAVETMKSQEAYPVLTPLRRALATEFGTPDGVPDGLELRSDNGSQFRSSLCADLCEKWGVEQTFSPPGRPTGNALAERVILTMKLEEIWLKDWESLAELRRALDAWRHTYNHERPHQALGWQTPAERREQLLGRARSHAA